MNQALKAAGALAVLTPVSAFAALPTAVTDAVTAAQTDGLTLVGIMLALGAAVFVIYKIGKRLVG